MPTERYLTKSRFKLATECPTKLFYTGKPQYADQNIDDPFLLELAKGGFQVGELAKCYFPDGEEVACEPGDYEQALQKTNELLKRENVTIFEAAVRYDKFFIRIDVLVKVGNRVEVIEVKSKSYKEGDSYFFGKKGESIDSKWQKYLYDIAFQKHVVQGAFPESSVSAFLLLTDKGAKCPTDGLNQKFRVRTDSNGRKYVELVGELTLDEKASWILRKVPVDDACERIFQGTDTKVRADKTLGERAAEFAGFYERDERISIPIFGDCKSCEFKATPEDEAAGKLDGFKECWAAELKWAAEDFASPLMLDLWDNRKKDEWIALRKIKMSDLVEQDLQIKQSERPGLSRTQRQWIQVQKSVANDRACHLDRAALQAEMSSWTFPLHFIDFETATPAIPFTKGRRPYEEIAFQFSHHTVDDNGRVEHTSQYLNDSIGVFPNFDFLRALYNELGGVKGTIFRYAAHENTYLNAIYRQMREFDGDFPDREELCEFVKNITKSTGKSEESWEGVRNMVDLREMVLRFYYDPHTKGSNSIKQVLPAILNSSKYLQEKYSKPTYGTEIQSLNFKEGKIWVEFDQNGSVKDPYSLLPLIYGKEFFDRLDDEFEELKDGGAAMAAYARLQFEDMSDTERMAIRDALLRYCELDTLAMVMIYEGWREMLKIRVD
jgi:hypothetical protein